MTFRKKGSIVDMFYIPLMVFVIGIVIVVGYVILGDINDSLEDNNLMGDKGKSIINDAHTRMPATFDAMFIFILFLMSLMAIVSAFFIRTHPSFFLVSLFLLVMASVVNVILSNTFESIMNTTELSAAAGEFTMMSSMMGIYPIVIIVLSVLLAIFLYSRGGEI